MRHVRLGGAAACALLYAFSASAQTASSPATGKIPITTASEEARQLYLKGRDLAEKLRGTDAHHLYEQAIAKDPNFALAYVGLANTSGTTKEFIEATTRAASLAGNVSEGERHIILGLEAGMKGEPASVLEHYTTLVTMFPNDERAQNLLANQYFNRQDYKTAVEHFVKATQINPTFSQPYNQLGYAYRFLEKYDEAERTFKKYTELIPDDPNPYDSYAELLMKRGRFDESIKSYEKALSIDPNFVASYIGIGNDYLFMG
ncbi:MAG TPA: tetratricopeptide repeat protein, partial [Vicinamibacterales bacterium]